MARNLKFPNPANTSRLKAETDQRITITSPGQTVIVAGGSTGGQLGAWKKAYPSAIYAQCVLEILCSAQLTLNDGTINSALGLYGTFSNGTSDERFLLGIIGYNLGQTVPQVRIHSATVGFAQVVNIATVYDSISLGAVFANVNVPGGATIAATLRPVIERDYGG